jgi:hypothetical protein
MTRFLYPHHKRKWKGTKGSNENNKGTHRAWCLFSSYEFVKSKNSYEYVSKWAWPEKKFFKASEISGFVIKCIIMSIAVAE